MHLTQSYYILLDCNLDLEQKLIVIILQYHIIANHFVPVFNGCGVMCRLLSLCAVQKVGVTGVSFMNARGGQTNADESFMSLTNMSKFRYQLSALGPFQLLSALIPPLQKQTLYLISHIYYFHFDICLYLTGYKLNTHVTWAQLFFFFNHLKGCNVGEE